MRTFLIPIVAAAAIVAVTAPAEAQPVPLGGGVSLNFGKGGHGVRALERRLDWVRGEIRSKEARRLMSRRQARELMSDAQDIQYRIDRGSRRGFNSGEKKRIERDITSLEFRVRSGSRWDGGRDHRGLGSSQDD